MIRKLRSIDLDRLEKAVHVLEKDCENKLIPGYEAIVLHEGKEILHTFGGFSEDHASCQRAMQENTLFDMASLTKVLATTTALLLLMERGEVRLSDRVAYFLPEFASHGKDEITLRQLLTHTSGLAAERPFHQYGWDRETIIKQILLSELVYKPDHDMVYSDLGFITLGECIQKVAGTSLDRFVKENIFSPLGMTHTTYLPAHDRSMIAATEYRDELGRHQCGDVHDENAGALGGVAGHAGLFSTAKDVARFAQMWLDEGAVDGKSFLAPLTVHAATRSYTAHINGANRGLGWVLKSDRWDASGDLSSAEAYGHTGFTGTSVIIDPTYQLAIVLLTNRVHYGRHPHIIRTRARFHNGVYASLSYE